MCSFLKHKRLSKLLYPVALGTVVAVSDVLNLHITGLLIFIRYLPKFANAGATVSISCFVLSVI